MIQELAPLLAMNATSLNLTEAEHNQLMSRPTFVIEDDPTTAAPVTLQVEDLLNLNNTETTTLETSQEVTSEVTTLAENERESKIVNEEVTATVVSTENSSTASEGKVEKEAIESPTTPVVPVVEVEEVEVEVITENTEATTALPDLETVLSDVILNLATFTDYEPESQVFQMIPSLDEIVLTCDILTASGSSAAVIGEENIRDMESQDLMNCLETLGQLPWTSSGRGAVWRALKSKIHLFSDSELRPIKREMMFQLHNLLPAVVEADPDLIDVTEDNIDGLSVIGK